MSINNKSRNRSRSLMRTGHIHGRPTVPSKRGLDTHKVVRRPTSKGLHSDQRSYVPMRSLGRGW